MASYFIKRGKRYHYRRRVPEDYQFLHPVKVIQEPLGTDSYTIAEQRAIALNKLIEDYWADLVHNGPDQNEARFKRIITLAKMSGFTYQLKESILEDAPISEIVHRISIAEQTNDKEATAAILGTAKSQDMRLSIALIQFLKHEEANLRDYSEEQLRKWRNPRKKALNNFIELIGDKIVSNATRDDILQFRLWWVERIKAGMSPNTANKEFSYIRQVLQFASDNYALSMDIDSLFKRINLKEEEQTSRISFETDFIVNVLLNREKMKFNEECQLLIYAMADTGARISELVGLDAHAGEIVLDAEIPYIKIRPNDIRKLKTPQSKRDIPLVGSSLVAFKELNNGFVRYLGKNTQISSAINKYFRENVILPSLDHSLYSLRHSFEDRLTAVEPPDKVQAALMGHKYHRPRYGKGPSLEQKKLWLDKIALI